MEVNRTGTGGRAGASEFRFFDNLDEFARAVQSESGVAFDFPSVVEISSFFVEATEDYLILNVPDYEATEPNNLVFLTQSKAFFYNGKPIPPEAFRPFERLFSRPFGRSTVLVFLVFNKALESYKRRLELLTAQMRELDRSFEYGQYRDVGNDFERLYDNLEEFDDLVLRLQQRGYRQVKTRYISFDYSVLLAESSSVQDRCRRRLNLLRELARDYEARVTTELNKRIERLNDVVKRLTAFTVILMIPNLIASHFGMNFVYMPELQVQWAYPAVIFGQILLMALGVVVFWKIGWL